MVKAVLLVVSLILSITVKVSSLQCYVCYDCAKINDENVLSCDSISPPSNSTTTPTPTSTSSTVSTTSTTEVSTANSTTTTTSTTEVPIANSTTTTTTTTEPSSNSTTTESSTINKADANYECFKGKLNVNGSDVVIRGCAVGRTNETCEFFGVTSCSFCNSDKCNAAASIQSSAVVLLVVFFLTLVKE